MASNLGRGLGSPEGASHRLFVGHVPTLYDRNTPCLVIYKQIRNSGRHGREVPQQYVTVDPRSMYPSSGQEAPMPLLHAVDSGNRHSISSGLPMSVEKAVVPLATHIDKRA